MALYETTQLYLGLATLVAALIIINYSRSRSSVAVTESRSMFRPLYVVALGYVVFSLGALATYIEDVIGQAVLVDTYYAFYAAAAVEVVLLGIAAAMILNARRVYLVPMSSGLASILLFYLAEAYPQTSDVLLLIGVLVPAVILASIGGLFAWITREAKRATGAALTFSLISQIAGLPVLYFDLLTGPVASMTLFIVLMGPAMVAFAFLRPDQKITFELFGYGTAFAAPALVMASVQSMGIAADLGLISIAAMGATAILFALGTASYLYGRWTETRQIPTILYVMAFLMFGIGQMTGMLENLGMFTSPDGIYIEFILTGYALTMLSVGAIYAAGWKSVGLAPLLAYVPISIMIIQAYPMSIGEAFLNLIYIIVPTIGLMLLPAAVFLGVWRRMRKRGISGSLRPLGVAVAIVLFFLIRLPPMVLGLGGLDYGYGLVCISFLMFWSALTGRLDRIVTVKN
jgi:hypothetical protein